MRSFLGITGHFVIDFALKSVLLTCSRFHGSYTEETIYQCYDEIVMEFEVANKIIAVVTDSAANLVKVFSVLGYVDIDKDRVEEDVVGLEQVILDKMEVDGDIDVLWNTTETISLPERVPCFAHILQLVVRDALKHAGQLKQSSTRCQA